MSFDPGSPRSPAAIPIWHNNFLPGENTHLQMLLAQYLLSNRKDIMYLNSGFLLFNPSKSPLGETFGRQSVPYSPSFLPLGGIRRDLGFVRSKEEIKS